MSLLILQISDLHFGQHASHLPPETALGAVASAVAALRSEKPYKLLVALCGDIVNKGDSSYYDVAARALEHDLLRLLGMPDVVCCPGNHDVVNGENGDFLAFNRFAFRLTNNAELVFDRDRSVCLIPVSGYEIVLVNSMFRGHEDRKRGEIQIEQLRHSLGRPHLLPRIVITHHSLIADDPHDPSSVANAYPVFRTIAASNVVAVLHGHMHSQTILSVGRRGTAVIGVGSLLYKPYPNYNNSFNVLRFDGELLAEACAFRYVADSVLGAAVATFEKMTIPTL